jgi:hypothetical protein
VTVAPKLIIKLWQKLPALSQSCGSNSQLHHKLMTKLGVTVTSLWLSWELLSNVCDKVGNYCHTFVIKLGVTHKFVIKLGVSHNFVIKLGVTVTSLWLSWWQLLPTLSQTCDSNSQLNHKLVTVTPNLITKLWLTPNFITNLWVTPNFITNVWQ